MTKPYIVTYWYSFSTGTTGCDDSEYDTFEAFLDDIEQIDCYASSTGTNITLSRNGKTMSLEPDEWIELRTIIRKKEEPADD